MNPTQLNNDRHAIVEPHVCMQSSTTRRLPVRSASSILFLIKLSLIKRTLMLEVVIQGCSLLLRVNSVMIYNYNIV